MSELKEEQNVLEREHVIPSDSIRITTFNIRYDNPEDGDHSWYNRIPAVKSMLQILDPDILCTQEGKEKQLMELQHLVHHLPIINGHRDWLKERMYPTIFFSFRKISVIDSGDVWLSETPDVPGSTAFNSTFPRLFCWSKLSFKKNLRPFFVLNVHLDHGTDETRLKQVEVLASEAKKINFENYPTIILGDFNSPADGEIYNLLLRQFPGLYDPWKSLGKNEIGTQNRFQNNFKEGKRIDWILLDKRFSAIKADIHTEMYDGTFPSDHFPVTVEFQFKDL